MAFSRLLVANRGEIAIRVARAASEIGIHSVGVYAEDDAASLHVAKVDTAFALEGSGVSAYLDGEQLISVARDNGCDAIHPGYGFLSENADFAAACVAAGVVFVGPPARWLELFGDKYPISWLRYKSIFTDGLADGSRSLLRYRPQM